MQGLTLSHFFLLTIFIAWASCWTEKFDGSSSAIWCGGNNVWTGRVQSDGRQTASKKGLKHRRSREASNPLSSLSGWSFHLWGNRAVARHFGGRAVKARSLQPHGSPRRPIHPQNDIHATLGLFRARVLALDDQMTARVWAPLRIKIIQERKGEWLEKRSDSGGKDCFQGFSPNMN